MGLKILYCSFEIKSWNFLSAIPDSIFHVHDTSTSIGFFRCWFLIRIEQLCKCFHLENSNKFKLVVTLSVSRMAKCIFRDNVVHWHNIADFISKLIYI